jgi:hypothetical protein
MCMFELKADTQLLTLLISETSGLKMLGKQPVFILRIVPDFYCMSNCSICWMLQQSVQVVIVGL